MRTLWTEKYRPQSLNEYVWVDPEMRALVERWLADGALPHVLFCGSPGTGKTSLAKMLFKALGVPDADILYLNASRERQVEALQDKVINFVDSWALGPTGIKYILLDEADFLSQTSQGFLRNEIETHSDITRWVLTANLGHKIISALHSRLQEIQFPSLDKEDFTLRVADIVDAERVRFDPEVLLEYVDMAYPDLRKCINLCQQNASTGTLLRRVKVEATVKDHIPVLVDLFKQKRFLDARKQLVQVRADGWDEFYTTLYSNLPLFGDTQEHQDDALLIIRDAMVKHSVVADPEINASACLIELSRIGR